MTNEEFKKSDPISDARIAMVEFSLEHFKDKTFKSYILEALAGDFCWELMRAIRAIQLPKTVVNECFTTADLEKQVEDLKESLQWLIEQIEEQTDTYAIESSIAFDLAKDRAK